MTVFGIHLSERVDRGAGAANGRRDSDVRLFAVEPLTDGRAGWRLAGEIDIANREYFTGLLTMMTAEECGADGMIHLDLAGLTFIDPAGTRALVHAAQRLYEMSAGRLALHQAPYSLRRIVDLLLQQIDVDARGILLLPASPGRAAQRRG